MEPDKYLSEIEVWSTITGMHEFALACLRTKRNQSWNTLMAAFELSSVLNSPSLQIWVQFQMDGKLVLSEFDEAAKKYISGDDAYWGTRLTGYNGHYFNGLKANHCYLNNDLAGMESVMPRLLDMPSNCKTPLDPLTAFCLYQILFLDLCGETSRMLNVLQSMSISLPIDQRQFLHLHVHRLRNQLHYGSIM